MTKTNTTTKKPPVLLTLDQKKDLVAKVDTLREQGLAVLQATKKVGVHMPTYYGYKKQIDKPVSKPKRKYVRKNVVVVPTKVSKSKAATALVPLKPMMPHTIEYIERPSSKSGTLMMVIGSPDTIFEFVKKMRGE